MILLAQTGCMASFVVCQNHFIFQPASLAAFIGLNTVLSMPNTAYADGAAGGSMFQQRPMHVIGWTAVVTLVLHCITLVVLLAWQPQTIFCTAQV